jgi:hypothetical protein
MAADLFDLAAENLERTTEWIGSRPVARFASR